MARRNAAKAVLLVLLLIGALPATVVAQSVPLNVLFDQETRKIASVSVDGETYDVYRIENLVPYASGIDIYHDGERVRSESTAEQVLRKLARRRAIAELGPDDMTELQQAKRNVSRAAPAVGESAQAINGTLVHLNDLKATEMDDTTAYNESVEAAPEIEEFNQTARELDGRLQSYQRDSKAFVSNATTLIELVNRRENGTSVDPQRLYAVYLATIEANDELSDHLGFGGVGEGLSEGAGLSETIAMNVSSVPETGNRTAEQFERVASSSRTAANRTQAIDLPGFAFEDTQNRAQSLESEWMDQWQSRQNAGTDVYYTIFGLIIAIVFIAAYVRRRRQ